MCKKTVILCILSMTILYSCILCGTQQVQAQDFYGQGNVLIAVDMSPYAENDDAVCREGTMGTLIWGDDAPEGVSTRPDFSFSTYTVPEDIVLPVAPEYEAVTKYHTGQKVILPIFRQDDPDYCGTAEISKDDFPAEVFEDPGRLFLYSPYYMKTVGDDVSFQIDFEKTEDGTIHPSCDFIELECVGISEYSTIWLYTGTVYSNRTGFDKNDYGEAPVLTDAGIALFEEICDSVYTREKTVFGDPACEDLNGDSDGKFACVIVQTNPFAGAACYNPYNTIFCSFDSLFFKLESLDDYPPDGEINREILEGYISHELSHYIGSTLTGYLKNYSKCVVEYFGQFAVLKVFPDEKEHLKNNLLFTKIEASKLRMIPGMLHNSGYDEDYSAYESSYYGLGAFFLEYVEREACGRSDGSFWAGFYAEFSPDVFITPDDQDDPDLYLSQIHLDRYLKRTTGTGLEDWIARFMAAVVTGAKDGPDSCGAESYLTHNGLDIYSFLRSYEEYGIDVSLLDPAVVEQINQRGLTLKAVKGGGTTYAYYNEAGGKIAITGADDDWYFFAVDMDIPDPEAVVEISGAADLRKMGSEDKYSLNRRFILMNDINLGGENDPMSPIGDCYQQFTGVFDGNGHTISGLYVCGNKNLGLFGCLGAGAAVRDLNVEGVVTGNYNVGGIAGASIGGDISNCTFSGSVRGEKRTGSIAGYLYGGSLYKCKGRTDTRLNRIGETGDMQSDYIYGNGNAKLLRISVFKNTAIINSLRKDDQTIFPIPSLKKRAAAGNEMLEQVVLRRTVRVIGKEAFLNEDQM